MEKGIEWFIDVIQPDSKLCVGFDLLTDDGSVILRTYQNDLAADTKPMLISGATVLKYEIQTGEHGSENNRWIVYDEPALGFDIHLARGLGFVGAAAEEHHVGWPLAKNEMGECADMIRN